MMTKTAVELGVCMCSIGVQRVGTSIHASFFEHPLRLLGCSQFDRSSSLHTERQIYELSGETPPKAPRAVPSIASFFSKKKR